MTASSKTCSGRPLCDERAVGALACGHPSRLRRRAGKRRLDAQMAEGRRVLVTGRRRLRGSDVGPTAGRQRALGAGSRQPDDGLTGRTSTASRSSFSRATSATPKALDAALSGVETVVHLAAAGSVVKSVEDPATNFDVNVVGTFQVLDAVRRAGLERTVLASTGGALIGDALPPVNEQSLPKPISPYGASKLAGEGYAHAFARAYGLRTVSLRFANVYGPWSERKQGAMTMFFRAIDAGEPIVIYGDGSASRDYTHVDDICRALELALEADADGRHRAAHRVGHRDHRPGAGRPVPRCCGRARPSHRVPPEAARRGRTQFRLVRPRPRGARIRAEQSGGRTGFVRPGSGSRSRCSAEATYRSPKATLIPSGR